VPKIARKLSLTAVSLLVTGAVSGLAATSQAAVAAPGGIHGGIHGTLNAVAAVSAGRASAVGSTNAFTPLVLRWNGFAWKRVSEPLASADLLGVTATSADNAWAVGYTTATSPFDGIIVHWNGTSWKRVL
jgi:hypothetical protein